jgi:hypothetical protein
LIALKDYIDAVVRDGCVLCEHLGLGETPAQFHHPRAQQGAAERAPDACGVPLCEPHHLGQLGIHGLGVNGFSRVYRMDELDLMAMTWRRFLRKVRFGA